jgi:hypothetical protein
MADVPFGGGFSNPFSGKEGVGDFFAPFFRVRFLTPNPNTLDAYGPDGELAAVSESSTVGAEILSSNGQTDITFSEGDSVGQLRSSATTLTISNVGGGASFATLVLEPTYEDALAIIEHRLLQYDSIMVIEWGWLGQGSSLFGAGGDQITSDPHYFVIQQPSLSINNLDVSIEIVGADLFGYASTQRTSTRLWDRNFFDYKTDLGILENLVRPSGLTIDTSLTNSPPVAGGAGGAGLGDLGLGQLDEVSAGNVTGIFTEHPIEGQPEVLEQNEKDWIFFNTICASNNCSFFTIGSTIFLADMNVVKTRQSSYRLLMYQQPTDDRDIPILNYQSNAQPFLFQPAESRETCVNHVNPDTNKVECIKTDPGTSDDFQFLGLKTASGKSKSDGVSVSVSSSDSVTPDPKFTDEQTGKVYSVPYYLVNKLEVAKQPARDGVMFGNTDANITIPGVPSIVPMMIVEVQGVGRTFNGPFIVMKTTHRLDTSGYETDLELVRDTSTADIEVGKGTQPPSTNTPSTDPSGDEGVTGVGGKLIS